MYSNNVVELIGNTPLLSLEESLGTKIFAKAEFLNPGGSIKDRIALHMIEVAEQDGRLKKGSLLWASAWDTMSSSSCRKI